MRELAIGNRFAGEGHPVLLIAELSANHGGSLETALATVEAMAASGADAVKLQTYTADTMTLDCADAPFTIRQGTIWDGRRLHDLYREAATPWAWHAPIKRAAEEAGLLFLSTPFDPSAADFLERLGVCAWKIASFEMNDTPLISHVAKKGGPMILSTGLSDRAEIAEAVRVCRAAGNDRIALLKCSSAYPAPFATMNLRGIPALASEFDAVAGLSDHSPGWVAPVAAAALGARIVEKHFILDRALGGPDASFSLEPGEFRAMAEAVRDAQASLGEATFEPAPGTRANMHFKRSLIAVADIAPGEPFTADNVRSLRPAIGLPPRHYAELLARRARRAIRRGAPILPEDLEG